MQICVIGTGYVGLVVGTCFAETGNEVICVDNDRDKLSKLAQGIIPIYEPGLEELIKVNVSNKRLTFSDDLDNAVKESLVCIIAVGTPQGLDGCADLSSIFEVSEKIGKAMNGYKVIVTKSTVPIGSTKKIADFIKKHTKFDFDIVSNPEFLKQGAAVDDFLRPDRVIIGTESENAADIMQEIYAPFVRNGNPILVMDTNSAEMTKYASNSFLAAKISFINEIANICEKVGADIDMVRTGMCSDSRIGSKFLFPGLGYGGSCFPKDVCAMIELAKEFECEHKVLKATHEINKQQRHLFVKKILKKFGEDLTGKTFAVWGLSFKPQTNDMREAPSITIIEELLLRGAKIVAYDPKAIENAKEIFKDKIKYAKTSYEALKRADAMLLLTEWNEFRHPDFDKIKSLLKNPIVIDGRNQYDGNKIRSMGIEYINIGGK